MKLSVIIVNRNACIALKRALVSLINATQKFDSELIVVDNASTDKSVEMIQNNFPDVQVIANETDRGISKAYNEAIKLSSGAYVLLTTSYIISCKGSLDKMTAFVDAHKGIGGMSIRILSEQGRFLPESVHGLTKPWMTFFKLIGFDKYFSKTRLSNRNRKDWVEEFQIAEVDILNSACMLVSRSALAQIGVFDERFSTFGHNIDLSYRMRLAGFKNYYYPNTYMINTERSNSSLLNWKYVKGYYGAMLKFAIKYLIRLPEIKVQGISQLFPSSYEVK